jgi:PAS domain S-box-containing protein
VDPLLRESIRIAWESPFPATLQDAAFRLVDVNPAYLEFTGYTRDALIGTDPLALQPEEDRASSAAARERLDEGEVKALIERRITDAQGRERWFRASRRLLRDAAGQALLFSQLQDSTAEHVARERADRSARELDNWFDLSPLGMVLFDARGLLVRTNAAFEALAGEVPVQLSDASESLRQLLGWGDGEALAALQPGSSALEGHAFVPQADGGLLRLRSIVRCYRTAEGHNRYMAAVEDRSVEEERDIAQMQIGAMMDTAGVALATFQESSGWLRQRHAPSTVPGGLGATSAALQNISRDIVMPESLADYEKLQYALRHAQRAELRYAVRHPELGQRWLLTRVEPATLASGKRTTSVVTLDVTEQHQAQQRSAQLLREMTTILESTTVGIAYLRGDLLVRCNRRFEAMLGLPAGAGAGSSTQELFGRDAQTQHIADQTLRALAEGDVFETEFEVVPQPGPSGTADPLRWYALSVRRTGAATGVIEAIAVLTDITRLKLQQAELELLARDRELMFSLSEVGIAYVRNGRIERANEALAQLTGWSAGELAALDMRALFPDEADYEQRWPQEERDLRVHGRWSGERQLRQRDGRLLWVQAGKRLVVEGDPSGGLIASYVNVDARHRAEQAVALQAARTRAILDSVLVGIVTVGPLGIEWMNRSARRMFGGDLADFVNQPMSAVATAEPEHPFRRTHYLNDLVEGQAETFECRVIARDGRAFWIVGNVVATGREASGRQLTFALLDIERRRQAEARMSEAQSSLQRIIEAAPLAITLRDAHSLRVLQLNQVALASTGRALDAVLGSTPEDLYEPDLALAMCNDMAQALQSPEVTQREYRLGAPGEEQVWDARYLPLAQPGHAPDQLLMVATDVTEQRAAQEARLKAALAQREMLVKEVHHRIKNNLQGVAGLLQQIAQRKPEVAGAISEVVGQVQAIAQVYGLQVGAGGTLRLHSVAEAIVASLQRTFGRPIRFEVRGEAPQDWALPEAESIPIALTLNELLTNAIKHSRAAQEGAPPEDVSCVLDSAPGGVRILIANEAQLPAGFNLSRFPGGVSGLGLVRALLPRRSATLGIEQVGPRVLATVALQPPGVTRLAPLAPGVPPG